MSRERLIHISVALHSDKESMDDELRSALGQDGYEALPDEVQGDLRRMLYEVIFEIEADPLTGKYKIISISDGDDVFVPQE